MPYYIGVYDIEEERVGKMLKLFRQYLTWIQNSVFEGELTEGQFKELKEEVKELMDEEEDSVIFFEVATEQYINRTVLGEDPGERERIL